MFLQLAANVVWKDSNARDKDGVLYTQYKTIGCGLAANINGQHKLQQLFPNVQETVKRYIPTTSKIRLLSTT